MIRQRACLTALPGGLWLVVAGTWPYGQEDALLAYMAGVAFICNPPAKARTLPAFVAFRHFRAAVGTPPIPSANASTAWHYKQIHVFNPPHHASLMSAGAGNAVAVWREGADMYFASCTVDLNCTCLTRRMDLRYFHFGGLLEYVPCCPWSTSRHIGRHPHWAGAGEGVPARGQLTRRGRSMDAGVDLTNAA